MPDPEDESGTENISAREQASKLLLRLEKLLLRVDEVTAVAEEANKPPPSVYAQALLFDAMSLFRGISDGRVCTSQPRIATDLLTLVAEMEKSDHLGLAYEFSAVLRVASSLGIAAESCSLNRKQIRPQPDSTQWSQE